MSEEMKPKTYTLALLIRITLAANLAEIKTDLVWIRKELQEMSDREYNQ